ncbi:MAG: 2-oxoglutarate dehydrogenase E1 component [Betaproteobacteria bacterium]
MNALPVARPVDATTGGDSRKDVAAALLGSYRRAGYLHADVNPLRSTEGWTPGASPLDFEHCLPPGLTQDLDDLPRLEELLRRSYCGALALNVAHVRSHEQLAWLYERMEQRPSGVSYGEGKRLAIYESLFAAEQFEREIAHRFAGHKRFSLEGCEAYIVFLQSAMECAAAANVKEVVMGMPHRGRVNVLYNVLKLGFGRICSLYSDDPDPSLATWDIKEHLGLSGSLATPAGEIGFFLAHNPSHLESVTPVITGMARASQEREGVRARAAVMPIIVHGDASFSGQGVVTETFNLARTRGYNVGGTVHVVLNNQIGSTVSNLLDARSTLNCADIARAYDIPILHVNADVPEAVVFAAETAVEFRQRFRSDILVDILGYRRRGHNGHDDPTVTQPAMQRAIRAKATTAQLYRDSLLQSATITEELVARVECQVLAGMSSPVSEDAPSSKPALPMEAVARTGVYANSTTAVPFQQLNLLTSSMASIPAGFAPHADIVALAHGWRACASEPANSVNWCLAENLAYATLLSASFNVRLTGLDIGRGSFFHRQCIWHDQQAGEDGESLHVPLRHLGKEQGTFSVFDTPLSEEAVLGFEYGYSVMASGSLVVWEAQFGDFVNNAQVIIDQFISCGEVKWGYKSGLVMMLPHGYEGGGPDHSSAYLGRFLSLCAQQNMVVAVPSTSAQLFHLLRRQLIGRIDKPLVVFTPKAQLYGKPASHSPWSDFTSAGFHPVVDTCPAGAAIERILVCSGKVAYDLTEAIAQRHDRTRGVVRIEQLYPFPAEALREILARHPSLSEVVWVQEEARNHGAWPVVRDWLETAMPPGIRLRCVSRPDSAPSAGCRRGAHLAELQDILGNALGAPAS